MDRICRRLFGHGRPARLRRRRAARQDGGEDDESAAGRELRLRHARHLLAASSRAITAIAADAGFADSSHLCRTFSELLDITPGAYRGLVRSSGSETQGAN